MNNQIKKDLNNVELNNIANAFKFYKSSEEDTEFGFDFEIRLTSGVLAICEVLGKHGLYTISVNWVDITNSEEVYCSISDSSIRQLEEMIRAE